MSSNPPCLDRSQEAAPGIASRCPYCDGAGALRIAAPDINRRVSAVVFHLHACTQCGLMYVVDPPHDLASYYRSDYYHVPSSAAEIEPHLSTQRVKLDLVQQYLSAGDLLEIGPGTGMFCRLAQVHGFNVFAIERDAGCVRFLNDALSVPCVQSTDPAATIAAEGRRYDVAALWHVIEHLDRPWQTLDAIVEHLKPGGFLVVAAPNPAAWQARVLAANWPHYDLPRHLYQLPMPWLRSYAYRHGLSVRLATTRDADSLYWNRFTWGMIAKRLIHWKRLQARAWDAGLAFGRLLQPWEEPEGRGSAYTMVLQRGK